MRTYYIAQETVLKALWGRKSKQFNIQKTKILTSGPITSWQIDGEKVERGADFASWIPKSLWTMTETI